MTPIAAKVVPPSYKQCAFMAAYKSLYNKTLDKLPSFLHSNRQIPNEGVFFGLILINKNKILVSIIGLGMFRLYKFVYNGNFCLCDAIFAFCKTNSKPIVSVESAFADSF